MTQMLFLSLYHSLIGERIVRLEVQEMRVGDQCMLKEEVYSTLTSEIDKPGLKEEEDPDWLSCWEREQQHMQR